MNAISTRVLRLLACTLFVAMLPTASAAERVYFTSDRASAAGKTETQVFSMNADGSNVRQHTRSPGTKARTYRCGADGPIFFQNEDALELLNARGEEESYLATKDIQYHSPRCSSDTRYLSVTAWDKVNEKGFIEVYERVGKRRVARWDGEEASWMRGHHTLIYKLLLSRGEGGRIDILTRDLDKPATAPQELYRYEIGEYVYNLSDPQFIGSGTRDFVFRVYDEHEYFYYLGELGKSFVRTRSKVLLSHHNVYAEQESSSPAQEDSSSEQEGSSLEQGQLTLAPDGKHAVFTEHPWNTPPSLYLINLRTRDSWKIAEGFNPVWSGDSARIYFNKDPDHYASYHDALKHNDEFREIYPKRLDGYEIYDYDLVRKQERRLTNNSVYDGFL